MRASESRDRELFENVQKDRSALSDLYKQYNPLIRKTVSRYKQTGIPEQLLETEAKLIIADSMKRYDPAKGPLSSYLDIGMKEMERAVNQLSPVYVPQATAAKIGEYRRLRDQFREENDRIPTFEEMSSLMKIKPAEARRLMQVTTRQVGLTGEDYEEPAKMEIPTNVKMQAETVFSKIEDPKQKIILEHIFGLHNKPMVRTDRELAQLTNMSESSVRNYKDRIIEVYRREYGD